VSADFDDFAEAVLALVAEIPPGRVMTYGDVAAALGSNAPRAVGRVMSHAGSDVPWWRVIRASGTPAAGFEARAFAHFAAEGTPTRADRVDLRRARWSPPAG
jgi:alkylated DNA nucleotide flippase Atl1